MSLGLPNTKFGAGQSIQRLGLTSRQYKVAPSIAEKAVFIPKPHDRVDFKLKPGGGSDSAKPLPALGQGGGSEDIPPLPGSGKGEDGAPTGANIAAGEFGVNGVTARFDKGAWSGQPGGYVEVQVNNTPDKMTGIQDPIPTQEEGRQVNNRQIHFTQQYDSYGRPRIGFSREPYDFAATKFVSVTSQIAFQANMAKLHEEYDQYLLTNQDGSGGEQAARQAQSGGLTQDAAAKEAGSGVMGGEKAAEMSQPQVMGREAAQAASEPAVMGQSKVDAMYEPAVMGQESASEGFKEIPIFGATSDKPEGGSVESGNGADSNSGKVSAKESFENQKAGSGETSEGGDDSDDAKKSGAGGKLEAAYGSGAGTDTRAGTLSVAV